MRPKVAHAIHSGGFYGAERVALDLLGQQAKSGAVEPVLLAFVDSEGQKNELAERTARLGCEVVRFATPPGFSLSALFRYARILRERGIDLVHSHGYKPNFFHLVTRALRRHEIPLVVTAHGYPRAARRLKSDLYHAFDLFMLSRAAAVAAVSAETAAFITSRNPKCRPEVIENGVDPDLRPGNRNPVREIFPDLGQGEPVIGSAGRLIPLKNHALLVDVCARLMKDRAFRLLIVGDGPLAAELDAKMRSDLPAGRARLLSFQSDILDWMNGMDIFVLPSLMEGMPMTLLEAGALSKAVVCSNVGGMPDVVTSGVNGWLAEAGSGPALESALADALDHRERRKEFGASLRRAVVERFSARAAHGKYLELYARVLGQKRK
jgi:glycosyltransferase involved in cell wall biosynthesis